jgi:hypothetical protein
MLLRHSANQAWRGRGAVAGARAGHRPRAARRAAAPAPAPRPRGPPPPRAAPGVPPPPAGGDNSGAGSEVYEVRESGDDVWAAIALPVAMASAEGQQVEYLVLDTDGALAEAAVEGYLRRLQAERDGEAAADARALGGGGGGGVEGGAGGGGEGGAADAWAPDATLLRRMALVRDAERGQIVQVRGGGGGPAAP